MTTLTKRAQRYAYAIAVADPLGEGPAEDRWSEYTAEAHAVASLTDRELAEQYDELGSVIQDQEAEIQRLRSELAGTHEQLARAMRLLSAAPFQGPV